MPKDINVKELVQYDTLSNFVPDLHSSVLVPCQNQNVIEVAALMDIQMVHHCFNLELGIAGMHLPIMQKPFQVEAKKRNNMTQPTMMSCCCYGSPALHLLHPKRMHLNILL